MCNTDLISHNYYKLLISNHSDASIKITNEHQKSEYAKVLTELMTTSLKQVQCLTEEETNIIRKCIGVYEKVYTTKELADAMNIDKAKMDRQLNNILEKIYHRILRGFPDLEEALKSKKIIKEEILDLPVDILYDLSPRLRNVLARLKVKTISDVINLSKREYKREFSVGEKTLNILFSYIEKLGLVFPEERIVIKQTKSEKIWNKHVELDKYLELEKNITQMSLCATSPKDKEELLSLKSLMDKLKALNEEEKYIDEKINELLTKKRNIQQEKDGIFADALNESFQKNFGGKR